MDPSLKLSINDNDPFKDPSICRRLIRRLMYLTIFKSDITFIVHKSIHEEFIDHIFNYSPSLVKVLQVHSRSRSFFPNNNTCHLFPLGVHSSSQVLSSVTRKMIWLQRLLKHFEVLININMLQCYNKCNLLLNPPP